MNPVSSKLPTKYGEFKIIVYPAERGLETIVLLTPKIDVSKPVFVRVHDECITGDSFGSLKCDCGEQKDASLRIISESGNGIFIYMRQEGRGIGLYEKIKAYNLQDDGYDTHEANIELGHKPDERIYDMVKNVLNDLGVKEIFLITNNPSKFDQVSKLGVKIVERVPLVISSNVFNNKYIETKKIKFKHFFDDDNYYFVGVNGIENSEQLEQLVNSIKEKKSQLLKIFISNDTLNINSFGNQDLLLNTNKIFKDTEKFDNFVPVLHYSFRYSTEPMKDLIIIKEKMPYVSHIQLDDLNKDHLEVLKYAVSKYFVIFPLTNDNFDFLLDNQDFVNIIIDKKVTILLDNSCGRGIRESSEKYKEKILKLLNKGINNIALAGGFGPDYLDSYFEMVDYFKINFSIDAASGLFSHDKFDVEKAERYVKNVIAQKYL